MAGASRRARSTWTGSGRSSTRESEPTSSTRRTPTSRAAARQQAVADAVGDEIASLGTFLRLPFMGDELATPLATDFSAWELAQLGWVRFRSGGRSLRCRLGGEPSSAGGESVLLGSDDNVAVISMWLGRSAPLPPPKGTLYGAGCTRR